MTENAEKEARKLRKSLERITDAVLLYIDQIDAMGAEITGEAGSRLAKLSNWLDMQNDGVRYSVLGVDFRNDDKKRRVRMLKARHMIRQMSNSSTSKRC